MDFFGRLLKGLGGEDDEQRQPDQPGGRPDEPRTSGIRFVYTPEQLEAALAALKTDDKKPKKKSSDSDPWAKSSGESNLPPVLALPAESRDKKTKLQLNQPAGPLLSEVEVNQKLERLSIEWDPKRGHIGSGFYGSVYLGRQKRSTAEGSVLWRPVAIKVIFKQEELQITEHMNELRAMEHMSHPHVVTCLLTAGPVTDFLGTSKIGFLAVMEALLGGSLSEWKAARQDPTSERQVWRINPLAQISAWAHQLLLGLVYMHTVVDVEHGDVSLRNVALSSCGTVKWIDLGWVTSRSRMVKRSEDLKNLAACLEGLWGWDPKLTPSQEAGGELVSKFLDFIHQLENWPRDQREEEVLELDFLADDPIQKFLSESL